MEIVAYAHGEDRGAMGWYYYLESQLDFSFTAACTPKHAISLLRVKDEVDVIGMPGEDKRGHDMFITIRWEKDGVAVPCSFHLPAGTVITGLA
jgi:hypothetical protein